MSLFFRLLGLAFLVVIFMYLWKSVLLLSGRPLLVFCDVGQGDAILFSYQRFQLLVDAGPDYAVIDCLQEYMPAFDTQIEVIVVSHPDSDHIKGFNAVFSLYSVGEVWLVPLYKKSAEFEAFLTALSSKIERGSQVKMLFQGQRMRMLPNFVVTVLSPDIPIRPTETLLSDVLSSNMELGNWDNERSIVLKLDYFATQILLTGDSGKETEQALLRQQLIDDIDILKAGHHGSKTSSTEAFIQTVRPEIAVISSGKNNSYGHPAPEVVQVLTESGAKVVRTDQEGDIVIELSSKGYTLK